MITVNKTEFLNAIKAVKSTCGKGEINPILATIHLKTIGQGLQLTTTDLTASARTIIEANVTEQIEICINADKLENIVNALDNIITIDLKDVVATIKSGKTHFDVIVLLPNDYPEIKFDLSDDKVVLSKDEFVKGINKTIIATTLDNQNLLSGICFTFNNDNYEIAATVGSRLSLVNFETNINKEGQYVIPHNILLNLTKVINNEVEIYFEDKKIIFKSGNYLYSSTLLTGQFPKYNKLIPQNQPLKAVINRTELLKSLEKVAIMSDARTNITVFNFINQNLHLTTSCDGGKAEDTIHVDFTGELKIAFNFRYVLEGIKAMQSETIEIGMSTATSASLIKGDFIYLVMPITIKE